MCNGDIYMKYVELHSRNICICIRIYVIHSYMCNWVHLDPPEKLLGDGLSTPVPLVCLICAIISNKTGIFD